MNNWTPTHGEFKDSSNLDVFEVKMERTIDTSGDVAARLTAETIRCIPREHTGDCCCYNGTHEWVGSNSRRSLTRNDWLTLSMSRTTANQSRGREPAEQKMSFSHAGAQDEFDQKISSSDLENRLSLIHI